ncbi:hypothetical protein ARAM_006897, partial [Aspergillus rambellii]
LRSTVYSIATMVAGISKRQQLRNERALQDLIRSVPGNDRCADCSAMNPGWASWNIGIFLCMRCAALHRKMGTHVSKVKSLSMDSWSSEQVDNMKSHGNTIMNKIFNPRNVKPPIPTDIDESDACMERFIRQKYQTQTLEDGKPKPPSRHDSGYTRSPDASPPPLPPKPARPFGFGLRSASSATNLKHHASSHRGRESPVGEGRSSFESKLTRLKEMGFTNERRNIIVLRELNGNLDKSIETLVRVGEGSQPPSQARTPAAAQDTSGNPFDQLDAKQPAQSLPPNGLIATPSLEQSFQNLQVAQPLFPHSTGGYPHSQTSAQSFFQQQAASPFAPAQAGFLSSPQPLDGGNNPFFQTGAQPLASMGTPSPSQNSSPFTQTNPFFSQMTPQPSPLPFQNQNQQFAAGLGAGYPHPPSHANTMPAPSTSPFGQPSPFQQPQLQLQSAPQGQAPFNPFQPMVAPTTPQGAGYQTSSPFGFPPSSQPLLSQPTGRVDKNSILALYNLSAPPPPISEQQPFQAPAAVNPAPASAAQFASVQNQPAHAFNPSDYNTAQQSAVNMQQAGLRNPFGAPQPTAQLPMQPSAYGVAAKPTAPGASSAFMRSHMSQQSVDINGFQNGRHSPDAFANLSSRHG